MRYLYALAGFSDPALAARAFELALGEVRTQNAPFVVQLLLANRDNGEATWERVRQHWDALLERFPANMAPRMLDGVKWVCRDAAFAADIRRFLADHPIPSGQRTVDQISERLGINVGFSTRLRETAAHALSAGIARIEASAAGSGH
jgi:hypothetical protein